MGYKDSGHYRQPLDRQPPSLARALAEREQNRHINGAFYGRGVYADGYARNACRFSRSPYQNMYRNMAAMNYMAHMQRRAFLADCYGLRPNCFQMTPKETFSAGLGMMFLAAAAQAQRNAYG